MHSNKRISNEPRYKRTTDIANKFLIQQNICRLPVDPFAIAERNNWKIVKVGDIAVDLKMTHEYVLTKLIKTNDGVSLYCDCLNQYKIVYNEKVRSQGRIKWTIMHEIGHIVLGHLSDYKHAIIARGGLEEKEYDALEKEADLFAGLVLAPPIVMLDLNITSKQKIIEFCKLSEEAAGYRLEFFNKWKVSNWKTNQNFNIRKLFYKFVHSKYCIVCNSNIIDEKAMHCIICGNKLKKGEGKMHYSDGYQLDQKGRATNCPICGNSELYDGNYCFICGTYLVNRCTNDNMDSDDFCGSANPGNARYCQYCGCETTFYRDQLLKDWREVKEEMEFKAEAAAGEDVLAHVFKPEEIDDLPF